MTDASQRLCACGSPARPRKSTTGTWPLRCDPCQRAKRAKYSAASYARTTPEYQRSNQYRTKYGITLEDYDAMFATQGGVCAICSAPDESLKKRLCVDHCHTTGAVRGLLCDNCNTALGKFRDNADTLRRAITYLEGG